MDCLVIELSLPRILIGTDNEAAPPPRDGIRIRSTLKRDIACATAVMGSHERTVRRKDQSAVVREWNSVRLDRIALPIDERWH